MMTSRKYLKRFGKGVIVFIISLLLGLITKIIFEVIAGNKHSIISSIWDGSFYAFLFLVCMIIPVLLMVKSVFNDNEFFMRGYMMKRGHRYPIGYMLKYCGFAMVGYLLLLIGVSLLFVFFSNSVSVLRHQTNTWYFQYILWTCSPFIPVAIISIALSVIWNKGKNKRNEALGYNLSIYGIVVYFFYLFVFRYLWVSSPILDYYMDYVTIHFLGRGFNINTNNTFILFLPLVIGTLMLSVVSVICKINRGEDYGIVGLIGIIYSTPLLFQVFLSGRIALNVGRILSIIIFYTIMTLIALLPCWTILYIVNVTKFGKVKPKRYNNKDPDDWGIPDDYDFHF